jgi:hypothetical protein
MKENKWLKKEIGDNRENKCTKKPRQPHSLPDWIPLY